MASLHEALQTLSPTAFSDVPLDEPGLSTYLQEAFAKCQILIDSVPPPPIESSVIPARSRANTLSSEASSLSEISTSTARPDPPIPEHAQYQKEWGKPIKLSAKENPMGMGVYKMSGKDGRGAWFARRSVHEGLDFSTWKDGLQAEFPESIKVLGGPGEGNIRGIGGERRVEKREIEGVGTMELYHLSAQFPGPTTPRDFVTLLLTSSSALPKPSSPPFSPKPGVKQDLPQFTEHPRHFMVISKPCIHPNCLPRDGFIRGLYESIEFIREIPFKPTKSASTTDLSRRGRVGGTSPPVDKEAIIRHARQKSADSPPSDGRARGKTISFAESRGSEAKGESMDLHDDVEEPLAPVEWIMITRSDPGGSVPRFMVERGTPSGIVSDAGKFLDWACKRSKQTLGEESMDGVKDPTRAILENNELEAYQTNGHLVGLEGDADVQHTSISEIPAQTLLPTEGSVSSQPGGLFSNIAHVAYSSIGTYAPQAVIDRLPNHTPSSSTPTVPSNPQPEPQTKNTMREPQAPSRASSTTSIATFASADSHLSSPSTSLKSTTASSSSKLPQLSHHDQELAKLATRKQKLDAKLLKTRERETKNKEELTSKEIERIRKAEEKHAREMAKAEEKHAKEVAALEAKRKREEARAEEKLKRAQDKDEKARLAREKEEMRGELEMARREKEILKAQVGVLQREVTGLVARLGKVEGGGKMVEEVKEEVQGGSGGGGSSRSGT